MDATAGHRRADRIAFDVASNPRQRSCASKLGFQHSPRWLPTDMRHCRSDCGLRRFVCLFLRPLPSLKKNCAPPEAKCRRKKPEK
jgi:hypothetical protein